MIMRVLRAIAAACACVWVAGSAYAYQPRITFREKHSFFNPVVIEKPEIARMYFGILEGAADYYRIDSLSPFQLYVNILVPDRKDSSLDMNVDVVSDNKTLLRLKGKGYRWERFLEPMARDRYLKGPDLDWRLRQGRYFIKVFNKRNIGRYTLSVGTKRSFSVAAVARAARALPEVKEVFFNKPAYSAFLTPVGFLFAGYCCAAAGIAAGVFWVVRKRMAS